MNKKKLLRACPICQNSVGPEILHTQNFVLTENHLLPTEYDVVSCGRCGFVYADTPASQKDYDEYYRKMSNYDMNCACSDSSLYIERAEWIKKFISNPTDSIIDIGCGNGQLILELRKLGFSNLTGLDPSEKCTLALKERGIGGITSSIFSIPTDNNYDCAILSGVLEHIYDVGRIMEAIKSLLKCHGLLFVCVPDSSRYQDYDSVPFDYFNIEHINHFEETSLINLGLRYGFSTTGFQKTTITLSRTTQPVIFCVYENKGESASNWQSYNRNCVSNYVEHTKKNAEIKNIIDQLIEMEEEIIVWGAGNYTSRLLASFGLEKCKILMIVDNDKHKQGNIIRGKTVYPPTAILEMKKTPTILIGAAVFCAEIFAEIKEMGLNNKVIALGNVNGRLA